MLSQKYYKMLSDSFSSWCTDGKTRAFPHSLADVGNPARLDMSIAKAGRLYDEDRDWVKLREDEVVVVQFEPISQSQSAFNVDFSPAVAQVQVQMNHWASSGFPKEGSRGQTSLRESVEPHWSYYIAIRLNRES